MRSSVTLACPWARWQLNATIAFAGSISFASLATRFDCAHAARIPSYVIRSSLSSFDEPIKSSKYTDTNTPRSPASSIDEATADRHSARLASSGDCLNPIGSTYFGPSLYGLRTVDHSDHSRAERNPLCRRMRFTRLREIE